jgi:hypothetical protein
LLTSIRLSKRNNMNMVIGGHAKHHNHQAAIYRVIADKTSFRIDFASIFGATIPPLNIT